MAESVIKSGIKRATTKVVLNSQTWQASGAGMFYCNVDSGLPLTSHRILAITIGDWGSLRKSDVIIPYIRPNDAVRFGIMSNVSSFGNPNSFIDFVILYD